MTKLSESAYIISINITEQSAKITIKLDTVLPTSVIPGGFERQANVRYQAR